MSTAPAQPGAAMTAGRVVVVSGLSGAGKTTGLKLLEDFGYEAVDNLPITLLRRLAAAEDEAGGAAPSERPPIAAGVDSRTRDFQPDRLAALLAELRQRAELAVQLLYFDCDDDVLLKRFTATRRRHPLAKDRPVADGIVAERRLLAPLQAEADVVVDTTTLALPELRQLLAAQFALDAQPGLSIMVLSFSYKLGLPREADLVFDVRFLRNPHYDEALRPRSGEDPAVAAYVAADPGYAGFFAQLADMAGGLVPRYAAEGKRYLTIGIGCTGGRHRSVVVAEALGRHLRGLGQRVDIRHRDRDLGNA